MGDGGSLVSEQEVVSADGAGASPRRGFLELVVAGSLLGLVGAWFGGIFAFLAPARRGALTGQGTIDCGGLDELPEGQAKLVQRHGGPVLVIRSGDEVTALDATCTHLGCVVRWDPERRQILCPCHAAVFDGAGNVVEGPPPRPLPRVAAVIRDGRVLVQGEGS